MVYYTRLDHFCQELFFLRSVTAPTMCATFTLLDKCHDSCSFIHSPYGLGNSALTAAIASSRVVVPFCLSQ